MHSTVSTTHFRKYKNTKYANMYKNCLPSTADLTAYTQNTKTKLQNLQNVTADVEHTTPTPPTLIVCYNVTIVVNDTIKPD